MAFIFDAAAGGYRLVCEATGALSPVVATEERAVLGLEWYCEDPAAEAVYLARQRARFKATIVGKKRTVEEAVRLGILPEIPRDAQDRFRELTAAEEALLIISADDAEDIAAGLRWDLMANGQAASRLPTDAEKASADSAFTELQQRAKVRITTNKVRFLADGLEAATVTFEGLVASAVAELGGALTAAVSPVDPVVVLTSDIPRLFTVRILDAAHWSKPLHVEAV